MRDVSYCYPQILSDSVHGDTSVAAAGRYERYCSLHYLITNYNKADYYGFELRDFDQMGIFFYKPYKNPQSNMLCITSINFERADLLYVDVILLFNTSTLL